MIDIRLLRENPQVFYESMKKRFQDYTIIDRFLEIDSRWRENTREINTLRSQRNSISLQISARVKSGEDTANLKDEVRSINSKLDEIEKDNVSIEEERVKIVNRIPNILENTVPVNKGDENNAFVRGNGIARVRKEDIEEYLKSTNGTGKYVEVKETFSHVDTMEKLNLIDLERATKISGARFYFTKNRLLKLELALINYGVDFLSERGFSVIEPPPMISSEVVWKATDQATFDDAIYKIEGENLCLISTSEHPIAAMLMNEILEKNELPIKVGGFSPCYRKEAGAHGKDTKGIFRVHYFKKIEQFIFCKPEDSWDFMDELTENTEKILQSFEIPYRVVNVCSGELGNLAAKKYDIEGWFPNQGKFRELASISNDLDYQARSLNIRYRNPDGNITIHTLNGTAIPTERMMVAIMENFTENGVIHIPKVLIPYTGFDTIQVQGED
ncbi:MAG: serine--tRNA ligase [Candidatus Thermoplasmatota archaeon]|jgi:seryl-tRNA synthetase|nr:serine--tRNA ligase [Candidatus Thermoplasmatota archaeon]MCL5988172.1 serine--tRNA ligase [Candidatus Thermoplasmatota archaeon]